MHTLSEHVPKVMSEHELSKQQCHSKDTSLTPRHLVAARAMPFYHLSLVVISKQLPHGRAKQWQNAESKLVNDHGYRVKHCGIWPCLHATLKHAKHAQ